jgi:hypothetical protein
MENKIDMKIPPTSKIKLFNMLPTAELSPLRPSRFSLKEIRAQADIMDVFARARQREIAQYARIDHLIHCHSTLELETLLLFVRLPKLTRRQVTCGFNRAKASQQATLSIYAYLCSQVKASVTVIC